MSSHPGFQVAPPLIAEYEASCDVFQKAATDILAKENGKKFVGMSNQARFVRQLHITATVPVTSTRQIKPRLMEYMLLFTESAAEFAIRKDPEKAPAYWGAWTAYVEAVVQSGIMVSGAGLQPPETATTLRLRDGKRQIHDGPYAESKETLAGFFVINVPDLNAALDWAARSPSASCGAVEVRPTLPPRPTAVA